MKLSELYEGFGSAIKTRAADKEALGDTIASTFDKMSRKDFILGLIKGLSDNGWKYYPETLYAFPNTNSVVPMYNYDKNIDTREGSLRLIGFCEDDEVSRYIDIEFVLDEKCFTIYKMTGATRTVDGDLFDSGLHGQCLSDGKVDRRMCDEYVDICYSYCIVNLRKCLELATYFYKIKDHYQKIKSWKSFTSMRMTSLCKALFPSDWIIEYDDKDEWKKARGLYESFGQGVKAKKATPRDAVKEMNLDVPLIGAISGIKEILDENGYHEVSALSGDLKLPLDYSCDNDRRHIVVCLFNRGTRKGLRTFKISIWIYRLGNDPNASVMTIEQHLDDAGHTSRYPLTLPHATKLSSEDGLRVTTKALDDLSTFFEKMKESIDVIDSTLAKYNIDGPRRGIPRWKTEEMIDSIVGNGYLLE